MHQGKVRYIGCSNFLTYQLVRAVGRTETLRLARFDCVQPRYNLLFRQIEREMLPFCGEEGVGVIPYNPIAGGLLSGKHVRGPPPPPEGRGSPSAPRRRMYQDRYWHDREFDTVEELRQLADEAGVSLVTLSVAWVAGESGDHRADHRGKQPGPARREPGRRGVRDRPRPQAAARRAHPGVPHGRRAPVTVTPGDAPGSRHAWRYASSQPRESSVRAVDGWYSAPIAPW